MSQRSITSFFARAAVGVSKAAKNSSPRKKTPPLSTASTTSASGEDSPVKRCKRAKLQKAIISSSEEEEEASAKGSKENNSGNSSVTPKATKKTKVRVSLTPRVAAKSPEETPKAIQEEEEEEASKPEEESTPKRKRTRANKAEPKAKREKKQKKEKEKEGEEGGDMVEAKKDSPGKKASPAKEKKQMPKKDSSSKKSPADFFGLKKVEPTSKDAETSRSFSDALRDRNYHPLEDAEWKRGEKVPYLGLARTLAVVEETSGRLKIVEILANYFRSVMVLTPEDLLPSVYLCLNRLAPAYEGMELGVGDTVIIRALAQATGRSAVQIKSESMKAGDLGIVAESSRGAQMTMFKPAPLTVRGVFAKLKQIAKMTGHSSQSSKISLIQGMLAACRESEARFLVRSLAGKLRIGLAEQSVLQALAHACVMTPPGQEFPPKVISAFSDCSSDAFKEVLDKEALGLKTAYCECPTYDVVIPVLLESGVSGLPAKCKLTPGIPLKPMLAHPTKGVQEVLTRFENAKFTCEWKYDGERAQIHMKDDGSIHVFSRNQENNTSKYPDVIARFAKCRSDGVHSCVIDSEAVAWDREKLQILPFQVLSTRKRKDASQSEIKVQVAIFAFDLLYLNGEPLVKKTFRERRELLHKHFKEVEGEFVFAKSADPETLEAIQEVLEESIKDKCEGLMVKTLDVDATYEIARRSHNWLKLKKDYLDGVGDTLDLVVLGGYAGKGKRTGGFGGFLLGCYDSENEEYQSICKIGTGFSEAALDAHTTNLSKHTIPQPKTYYSYDPSLAPDTWFEAAVVWEVKAADLSVSPVHKAAVGIVDSDRGISLRFPRFIRVREDKSADDCTTAQQVAEMYSNQEMVKNTGKKPPLKTSEFDF